MNDPFFPTTSEDEGVNNSPSTKKGKGNRNGTVKRLPGARFASKNNGRKMAANPMYYRKKK